VRANAPLLPAHQTRTAQVRAESGRMPSRPASDTTNAPECPQQLVCSISGSVQEGTQERERERDRVCVCACEAHHILTLAIPYS
jgi:hypothetical protein